MWQEVQAPLQFEEPHEIASQLRQALVIVVVEQTIKYTTSHTDK
jgi:hypothetical protein